MDLSVIIVTYNSADYIAECLSSVLASEGVKLEVFVVDNASNDDGVTLVREKFPGVRLIVNSTNLGFGAANNRAMPYCEGRYTILLNPDTTVKADSFLNMARFMDSHPKVGLAGPRVENPDATRQDSVSQRYPGHRYLDGDLGKLPGDIACVLGACQIARTDLLRSIKGFDEDFFLYGEDQDICLRVRRQGLEIGFIPEAVIMHHGGHSERKTEPAEVVRKKLRAEHLFYKKHYSAGTIERIKAAQRRKALWRIFSIRALMPVTADKEKALRALARYRVMYEENLPGRD